MKSKFIFPFGCLALGTAIGWVVKSAPPAGTSGSASDAGINLCIDLWDFA